MKALFFEAHGGLEQLKFGDLPDPTPVSGQVIVRVRACALNHLDLWVLGGWKGLNLALPHVGGADIVGDIMDRADDVRGWRKGAMVAVCPGYLPSGTDDEFVKRGEESLSPHYRIIGEHCRGGFAEYVSVPANCLLALPPNVNVSHAAASLLVGTTAWRMLKHRAQLKKGETILVVGSGGGVNSFAIRLAAAMGARVLAIASTDEKMVRARQLGANDVVNYRSNPEWAREIKRLTDGRGVDVVVDNVGAETFSQSLHSLCRGGRLVTVGNTKGYDIAFDNRLIFSKQISILGSTMGSYKDFREAAQFAWSQPSGLFVDRQMPLRDGKEAYGRLEKGEQAGKIILAP